MKGKKLLVLAAAGLLGVVSLAGCGKKKSDTKPSGEDTPVDPKPVEPTAADGVFSYVNESSEERTKILGILEKYAVDEKLTGLTLFNNGGYAVYDSSLTKGTNSYIRGYGFGILGEGEITADLAGETNTAWKRYLHSYESEDPQYLLSMNDKGSVVSDLVGYVNASYWTTKMNRTKDGYDWVGDLAKQDRPTALNANSLGLATKYRFEVKVGSELKYTTNSTKYAAYNNREVALEDYITPYKIYYTKANGLERGSEMLTGAGSIKGAASYYSASSTGFNAEKWANVGIKAYAEGGKNYLEFEFNLPCNPFFAMYYLANDMFAPIPQSFIDEIGGVENWGANSSDLSEGILDHWLCTGPYALEAWNKDQEIVFKRNPNYARGERYKIEGVHLQVLEAINNDPEAAIKEFEAHKIHSCGVPYTKLDEYLSDPRVTTTIGSSNFKLNLNTCDQATWNTLFGEEGTITETEEADYWECKPAMANKDFVSGLSFAIDRQSLARKLGRQPAFEYFSPTYLSDPENGVYYNDTDAHKAAVKSLQEGTDGFGYSLELAKAAFQRAAEKLVADGAYNEGDTVEIEIAWMYAADEDEYHADIAKNLEDAFNTEENPLKLDVKFWVGSKWSDVYYNKMMVGQFDIGFGSISGNTYDPLSFMNVLSTDPVINDNFCLNWGIDTNALNAENKIVYDNEIWSYDALFMAATEGVYAKAGQNSNVETGLVNPAVTRNEDGTLTFEADFLEKQIKNENGDVIVNSYVSDIHIYDGVTSIDLPIVREDFVISAAEGEGMEEYKHIKVTFDAATAATLDNATTNKYAAYGYLMFDIYYTKDVFGITGSPAIVGSCYLLSGIPAAGTSAPAAALIFE